jgi:hypothetical protein
MKRRALETLTEPTQRTPPIQSNQALLAFLEGL